MRSQLSSSRRILALNAGGSKREDKRRLTTETQRHREPLKTSQLQIHVFHSALLNLASTIFSPCWSLPSALPNEANAWRHFRSSISVALAILAFRGHVQVWQLYLMNPLVAAGFWMFWPTITALIQELTPEGEFVQSNTFLLAGVQGGWLIAGAIVGFMYNHIGLGG